MDGVGPSATFTAIIVIKSLGQVDRGKAPDQWLILGVAEVFSDGAPWLQPLFFPGVSTMSQKVERPSFGSGCAPGPIYTHTAEWITIQRLQTMLQHTWF